MIAIRLLDQTHQKFYKTQERSSLHSMWARPFYHTHIRACHVMMKRQRSQNSENTILIWIYKDKVKEK